MKSIEEWLNKSEKRCWALSLSVTIGFAIFVVVTDYLHYGDTSYIMRIVSWAIGR